MDTSQILIAVVVGTCLTILVWAGRKRFPLRIGLGNFFRRKTQVAIVVAGLLIGTAIITSSFVIQSTFDFTIRSAVFRSLDLVDETIFVASTDGARLPFNISVYDSLNASLRSMPDVSALAPRIQLNGAVIDQASRLFEPTVTLIGFDPGRDLGSFVRGDGSRWTGSGLDPTQAILNEKLAATVEAKVGDRLTLNFGGPRGPIVLPVSVAAIVQNLGRGAWNAGNNLFVRLDSFQSALGVTNQVNTIHVANVGGGEQGYLRSDAVVTQIRPLLPVTPSFTIAKAKADSVKGATEGVDRLSQVFVLLSFFTIIAGVLLIVNIFVMLAEERKGEMGVARALGMRRQNLVQSFVSEGLLYALLSSFVGMLAGLFIAAVILWGFSLVFQTGFGGTGFILTWTSSDLVTGFAIGFLITMATIGIASFRVSKLNIVRAIRDIPEPVPHRSTRRQVAVGATLAAIGAIGTVASLVTRNLILQEAGPCALAVGLAFLTMRLTSPRIVFTAAGILMLAWLLSPWKPFSTANADISLFIIVGVLLIFGGLLIVLFNSDTILAVATQLFRSRTWRPVVRTAIAYPMNKKFRTGATLASIALVMFTIATMSGIQAMVSSSISTTSVRESGGFELLGRSFVPVPDWDTAFAGYQTATRSSNITEQHGIPQKGLLITPSGNASVQYHSSLIGVPSTWTPPLPLQARSPIYANDAAAWAAIQTNPDVAIIDGSVVPNNFGPNFGRFVAVVGDVFRFQNLTGATRTVKVIGILYEQFVQGLWISAATLRADFREQDASLFYIGVRPGVDASKAGHDLERYFLAYQLITVDIQALINDILETTMGVFNLLQAYLALGLIVGIAGLGVITMRNVVERRQETGALRALGFRKSMVLRSFLFELSFIALTGITMGVVLGVALSYDLFLRFFEGQASFIIPWDRLVLLGGIAFLGSVLATASPAIRASKMPPAEALRSFE